MPRAHALCAGAAAAAAGAAARGPCADPQMRWVNASCWGFDPVDATPALQAAINSGAATVFVPNMGAPWSVGPIHLNVSGQAVQLAEGVEVVARRGAFLGKGDSLVTIAAPVTGVSLMGGGRGAALRMRRDDYVQPPYEASPFRMGINVIGAVDVVIANLRVVDAGGDGIYVGGSDSHAHADSVNVTLRDISIDRASRLGIGVTGARGLLVEDTVVNNTHGFSPESGVDIEPGSKYHHMEDIVFRNFVVANSNSHNFAVSMHGVDTPPSVLLDNVTLLGGRLGGYYFVYFGSDGTVKDGSVTVRGGSVTNQREACLIFEHKSPDGAHISVEGTVLRNCADRGSTGNYAKPVFINGKGASGGISFSRVVVYDHYARDFLEGKSSGGIVNVSGTFEIHNPTGSCGYEYKPPTGNATRSNNVSVVSCFNN